MKLSRLGKKNSTLKKAIVLVFVLLLAGSDLFAAQCSVKSSKGSFSVNLNEMMNCAEERYGYDKNTSRRSTQKEQAPEVSIFFDKTSPKEGEKLTATAVPKGFKTAPEELYYTWYIIHTDDDGKVVDSDDDDSTTDEIENGKREAMGKVARGSFDPILFAVPWQDYEDNDDEDNDGFLASFGGVYGVGAKRIGAAGGAEDEDNDGIEDDDDNCETIYNPSQADQDRDGVGDWCDDDIDGDGIDNTEDNCVYTMNPRVQTGTDPEGNPTYAQPDSDSDGLGNACDFNSGEDDEFDNDGVADDHDNCPTTPNPMQRDLDGDDIGTGCDAEEDVVDSPGVIGQWEEFDKTGVVKTSSITRCYRHNFGTKSNIEDVQAITELTEDETGTGIKRDRAGRDLVIECEHKFPLYNTNNQQWEYEGHDMCADTDGMEIGDGEFTGEEESCWKLNPNNPDTDGDGVEDEADLAGLNQQHFTWNYKKGDRVGVAIEGTSMIPTNEDYLNSYYKIMWAAPGICSTEDMDFIKKNNANEGGDECDDTGGIGDEGFNYLNTLEVDKQAQMNLDTTLSSSPENPQYDFYAPEDSDIITVSAAVSNEPADERYVYYDWSIYRCGTDFDKCVSDKTYSDLASMDEEEGVYLTSSCSPGKEQDLDDCAVEIDKPLAGLGIKEIDFRPKKDLMDSSKEYFKVVLKTKRKQSDPNYAVSDIVVAVTQNDLELNFYTVTKNTDDKYVKNEEICKDTEGLYKRMCPVYPNQIIAAEVTPRKDDQSAFRVESYAWQLNGAPIYPPYNCAFGECDMGRTVYFPITDEQLAIGDISVTAKRRNGEDLIAQRMYTVNSPMARIFTEDDESAWPFIRFDGQEVDNIFESYPGSYVSFRADLIPDYLALDEHTKLTWLIDGTPITDTAVAKNPSYEIKLEDENQIGFRILGEAGTSVTLSARVDRDFSEEEASLLKASWNILPPASLRSQLDAEIKIMPAASVLVPEGEETASLKFFLASTVQNAPKFIVFTLRMVIGIVLIFSLLWGVSNSFSFKR